MESTHQDNFDMAVSEWAEADAECRRLYILWADACARQRRLAKAKNQAWRELNAARVTELSK